MKRMIQTNLRPIKKTKKGRLNMPDMINNQKLLVGWIFTRFCKYMQLDAPPFTACGYPWCLLLDTHQISPANLQTSLLKLQPVAMRLGESGALGFVPPCRSPWHFECDRIGMIWYDSPRGGSPSKTKGILLSGDQKNTGPLFHLWETDFDSACDLKKNCDFGSWGFHMISSYPACFKRLKTVCSNQALLCQRSVPPKANNLRQTLANPHFFAS